MERYDFCTVNVGLASINVVCAVVNIYIVFTIDTPLFILNGFAAGLSLYIAHYCVRK